MNKLSPMVPKAAVVLAGALGYLSNSNALLLSPTSYRTFPAEPRESRKVHTIPFSASIELTGRPAHQAPGHASRFKLKMAKSDENDGLNSPEKREV